MTGKASMSEMGQKRRFGRGSTMSGLRPKADVATSVRLVRLGANSDIAAGASNWSDQFIE
jgi:hypothetical protein